MKGRQRKVAAVKSRKPPARSRWFAPPPKEREEPGKPPPISPPRPLVRYWFARDGELNVKAVLIRDAHQRRLMAWVERLEAARSAAVFGASVCRNCRPGHTKAHEITRKTAVHIGEDFYRRSAAEEAQPPGYLAGRIHAAAAERGILNRLEE